MTKLDFEQLIQYDQGINPPFPDGTPTIKLEEFSPQRSVYERALDTGVLDSELDQLCPVLRETVDVLLQKGILVEVTYYDGMGEGFREIKPREIGIIDFPSSNLTNI